MRRFFALLLLAVCPTLFAEPLPLTEYLAQVRRLNTAYIGRVENAEATLSTAQAATLLFGPQLFANANYIYDIRNTFIPAIEGTKNIRQTGSFGVRKQFDFGLQLQLSLDINHTILYGTDPLIVVQPDKTIVTPTPYYSFPLWQNWMGRMERAHASVMEAQAKAQAYGDAYQAKAMLIEAEGRYWKLAALRELVRIEKASVERAVAIRDLNAKKAKRQLVDEADVLIAQAAVQGKTLELASYQDEERSAAIAFNAARGLDTDAVPEELHLPDADTLRALAVPKRAAKRGDVKAAEQATIATTAGSTMAVEKLKPELNLYGSVYAIGINLTVPLDLGTTDDLRGAYAKQGAAAELVYRKKLLDQDTDWNDLTRKFREAKERLATATELEKIQLRKYETIKRRQRVGLTIAYQVFQYELDYLSAAVARVQLEGQILGLHAQMKLYDESEAAR